MSDNSIEAFPEAVFALAPDLRGKVTVAFAFDAERRRRGYRMTDVVTGWQHTVLDPGEPTSSQVFAKHLVDWYGSHADDVQAGVSTAAEPSDDELSKGGCLGLFHTFVVGSVQARIGTLLRGDELLAAGTRSMQDKGVLLSIGSWQPHPNGARRTYLWQPEADAA